MTDRPNRMDVDASLAHDFERTAEPPLDAIRDAARLLREIGKTEQLTWVAHWLDGYADRHQAADDRDMAAVMEPEPFLHAYDPSFPPGERWRVWRIHNYDRPGEPDSSDDMDVGYPTEADARADAHRRADRLRASQEHSS